MTTNLAEKIKQASLSSEIFDLFDVYSGELDDQFTYDFLGPWISRGYAAAKQYGFDDIHVIGVEGEPTHFDYMETHLKDNDISEDESTLVLGVASGTSGVTLFPVADNPESAWGLRKIGKEGNDKDALLAEVGAVQHPDDPSLFKINKSPAKYAFQQSVSLTDLMKEHEVIDYIHIDIQGAELEVMEAGISDLNEKCRIIVIGTHSKEIEVELRKIAADNEWHLEHDETMFERGDNSGRWQDGCQVWVNQRFIR